MCLRCPFFASQAWLSSVRTSRHLLNCRVHLLPPPRMPCSDAACPTAPPLRAIDAARPISTAPHAPRCLSPEVTCSSYSRGGPVLQLRLAPDSGSPSVAENAGEIPCLTLHGQAVLRAPLLQVLCSTRHSGPLRRTTDRAAGLRGLQEGAAAAGVPVGEEDGNRADPAAAQGEAVGFTRVAGRAYRVL
ncbi:hypothetical protein BDA96_04G381000 [Sorghum bicolor]|uniref:Uncharacterized protein n=1 Tax=Sorghum bicolor TaxID=4558 RepID=A0A921UKK2_SORBI|nr:hypothetical protein BDA96_04G381000 [Sorghum bicolor]